MSVNSKNYLCHTLTTTKKQIILHLKDESNMNLLYSEKNDSSLIIDLIISFFLHKKILYDITR